MYHLTPTGDPKRCTAKAGNCPYGALDEHFETEKAARSFYENTHNQKISLRKSITHEIKLSPEVSNLLEDLNSFKFEPYIVGGSVRDSLLSETRPKDIDIEVFQAQDMDNLEEKIKKAGYKVDSVGKSFGVLKVTLSSGEDIDISLPRKDSKVGDGHKGFEVTVDPSLSLEEAAGRRDFTINSLYYSHKNKQVKDPYNGLEDYRKGELRHINHHFSEDPLRVIRGIQFAARFKMKLAPETAILCQELKSEFHSLATERIQIEFEKMYAKGDFKYGVNALKQTGWADKLKLESIDNSTVSNVVSASQRAELMNADKAVYSTSALLQKRAADDKKFIASYSIVGEKRQRKAIALSEVNGPDDYSQKTIKSWARQLGKRGLTAKDYYILTGDEQVKKVAQLSQTFEEPIPDIVTGALILEHSNQKTGPWIGELMRKAGQAQDDEVFRTKEEAIGWLQRELTR